jgi:GNAT superfamily N-acetyltransferase
MKAVEISEATFENFLRARADPLFTTLPAYEAWRQEMGILRTSWASGEERLALLGVEEDGHLVAVARALRVPFHERKRWGGQGEARGEVQDIALARLDDTLLASLLRAAEELFQTHGLTAFGVSAWVPEQWPLLERLGLSPYKRSVLLGWEVAQPLPKAGNFNVVVRLGAPKERPLLRRIQAASWGFFIPPDFSRQEVLLAWLDERPVGSAYLNRATGNLDFGVHVVRELWQQRVGTALLEAARQQCLAWGLPRMTVVRVLRALTRINPTDRQAWCFYRACGGELLREVRGFRRKKRPRPLVVPELPRCE